MATPYYNDWAARGSTEQQAQDPYTPVEQDYYHTHVMRLPLVNPAGVSSAEDRHSSLAEIDKLAYVPALQHDAASKSIQAAKAKLMAPNTLPGNEVNDVLRNVNGFIDEANDNRERWQKSDKLPLFTWRTPPTEEEVHNRLAAADNIMRNMHDADVLTEAFDTLNGVLNSLIESLPAHDADTEEDAQDMDADLDVEEANEVLTAFNDAVELARGGTPGDNSMIIEDETSGSDTESGEEW